MPTIGKSGSGAVGGGDGGGLACDERRLEAGVGMCNYLNGINCASLHDARAVCGKICPREYRLRGRQRQSGIGMAMGAPASVL